MTRVIVGMSGGVDSAVAAYLMKIAGYEVVGVTLRTWVRVDGQESRCCEIDDAQKVADVLGIPYYVVNSMPEFTRTVTEPFVDAYLHGLTPNPCVVCNRTVKWAKMLETARVMQASHIVTGHYASVVRLPDGRYTVETAGHAEKDQTYMLYRLTQEQLAATLMPLGKLSKEEVRGIAEKAGLPVASKPDSQEICFVPDGHYSAYIEEHAAQVPGTGHFVDEEGRILGNHRGIIHYTVGQRKGLGIALGHPAFVKEIRADRNEVVLGDEASLMERVIYCTDLNYLSIPGILPGEKLPARVKIRYHHAAQPALIEAAGEDRVRVVFEEPVRAPAPGQSAVFYDDDDRVIGGGIIRGSEKA